MTAQDAALASGGQDPSSSGRVMLGLHVDHEEAGAPAQTGRGWYGSWGSLHRRDILHRGRRIVICDGHLAHAKRLGCGGVVVSLVLQVVGWDSAAHSGAIPATFLF